MNAHDLLIKYLDFSCNWNSDGLLLEPAGVIKKQQILALLKAFNLMKQQADLLDDYHMGGGNTILHRAETLKQFSDIDYFERGEFLWDRKHDYNQEILELITSSIPEYDSVIAAYSPSRWKVEIKRLFTNLLSFRKEVFKLTQPWDGMLEGFSAGLYYSNMLSAKRKEEINHQTTNIDRVLSMLIDPMKREFNLKELTDTYGYPTIDPSSLIRDWRLDEC